MKNKKTTLQKKTRLVFPNRSVCDTEPVKLLSPDKYLPAIFFFLITIILFFFFLAQNRGNQTIKWVFSSLGQNIIDSPSMSKR